MKSKLNNKYFRWGLTAFLVIVACICFDYLLFHGTNIKKGFNTVIGILMPIVFGLAMAYLMTPVLNFIEYRMLFPLCSKCKIKMTSKRGKLIRAISILLTVFLFFAIVCGLIFMMLSQIVPSIVNIISNFDQYVNNFTRWLNRLLLDYPDVKNNVLKMVDKYSEELGKWLNDVVVSKSSELLKTVSLSVINILKFLWNMIIGLIISIYVLASKEKFAGQAKKLAYAIFNRDFANIVINNFRFTHRTFIGFLSGKILDSIIIGLMCFIGTSFLQTPYAALVSVIVGVTNIIPFFGPYLGAIPSTILIFVVDPLHPLNCVYFVIFIIILQQFDGNFLGPRILGNSTGLTGFWVIFAITLFGGLFGVTGMIVGVPIFAVIYAAVKSLVNASLKKKNIPQDSEAYIDVAAVTEEGIYRYVPDYKLKKSEKGKNPFGREFISGLGYAFNKAEKVMWNFEANEESGNSESGNGESANSQSEDDGAGGGTAGEDSVGEDNPDATDSHRKLADSVFDAEDAGRRKTEDEK